MPTLAPFDVVETYAYNAIDSLERMTTTHLILTPDPNAPTPGTPPLASSVSWIGWYCGPITIEAGSLSDGGALRLRWAKLAAVVVRALTEQPYADR